MTDYLLGLLLGYIIGSFPTAYLLVKWKSRLDIRKAGTGNVGAMNAFDVTNSKLLGFGVLGFDLLKGMAAVELSSYFFGHSFWIMGVGGLASIVGHNFSPWLRFKGGRGLATAAGVMLILGWIIVALWCTLWALTYAYAKSVHLSNISASILTPAVIAFTPESVLRILLNEYPGYNNFLFMTAATCALVLLRHYQYFTELRTLFQKKFLETL